MGFFTKKLVTLAPLAIGGILAIFFLRNVATKGFQTAGSEFGTGLMSLGAGSGGALSTFGAGVGGLGTGIGEGISGLFKPIWELKNLADAFGLTSISQLSTVSAEKSPVASAIRSGSASQRVSSKPRVNTGGSITSGSLGGHGGSWSLNI